MTTAVEEQPFGARKAVHFHQATLQDFEPERPYAPLSKKAQGKRKADEAEASEEPSIAPTISIGSEDGADDETSGQAGAILQEGVRYDVVWIQWCLQHLSDPDLLAFLRRCRSALKEARDASSAPSSAKHLLNEEDELSGGMLFVKENVCGEEADGTERSIWDDEDHSITRSTKAYERVFREAGLEIVDSQIQLGLPEELFVVRM